MVTSELKNINFITILLSHPLLIGDGNARDLQGQGQLEGAGWRGRSGDQLRSLQRYLHEHNQQGCELNLYIYERVHLYCTSEHRP